MAAQLKIIGSGVDSPSMDRQKALEAALAQIDRAFGKGSAMQLGSRAKIEIATIPSGSLGLDGIVSISIFSRLPSFIAEPLPNARSIWASAASSAFCRSIPEFCNLGVSTPLPM